MEVEELGPDWRQAAAALWDVSGLTRPWNDPLDDFDRAIDGPTSAVLGSVADDGRLLATAMVGNDGHRGWIYYVAVDPAVRSQGLGRRMVNAAEVWLAASGAVKVQTMVRAANAEARGFYERIGYDEAEVQVVARWL